MTALKHLWAQHRLAFAAFVIALAALGYFSVKTTASMIYWMDPAHREQPLADWMTPRYVAQSYDLPRDIIEEVFFIERGDEPRRIRLSDIAAENNMTMDQMQARIDAAKSAFEARRDQ